MVNWHIYTGDKGITFCGWQCSMWSQEENVGRPCLRVFTKALFRGIQEVLDDNGNMAAIEQLIYDQELSKEDEEE